eukprot:Phypoly_transcript_21065.p1 GENE.Phypoly_transcript_21065~~Phypoly_transcript_21065.p1  ORF type:complete len:216 (+),score=39.57 Phypoly_transcript_21065:45-650(+)
MKDAKQHAWTNGLIFEKQGVPGDVVLAHVSEMFEHYATSERLSCCGLQGGFIIKVNKKLWNYTGCLDEFWMTATWFSGLVKLLESNDPKATSGAFPWEESHVEMQRDGDIVNIRDGSPPNYSAGKPTDVNLWQLVNGLLQEGKIFHSYLRKLVDMSEEHKNEEKYKKGTATLIDNLAGTVESLETDMPKLQELYDTYAPAK